MCCSKKFGSSGEQNVAFSGNVCGVSQPSIVLKLIGVGRLETGLTAPVIGGCFPRLAIWLYRRHSSQIIEEIRWQVEVIGVVWQNWVLVSKHVWDCGHRGI